MASIASLATGSRPIQNIPESEKNEEWAQRNVDWAIAMSPIYQRREEDKLYDTYNGERKDEDFKHITETYGIEFPAGKIKHIPLARPLLNTLAGEYEERPFNFVVRSEDNDAINSKLEKISSNLLQELIDLINQGSPVDITMDNLERYYKEDFRTELEIASQHAMNAYIQKHHLERKFSECFIDKLVTGKQYYRVRVNRLGEDPEYLPIRPGSLFYSFDNVKWVKECEWAVHPERMVPSQILDLWGEKMTEEQRRRLMNHIDMYQRDSYKLNSMESADDLIDNAEDYRSYMMSLSNKMTVYHVEWKSIRKVYYIENPNKYAPDSPFIKFIQEDKLHELPRSKRKNLNIRYIQDLWQGVRVGDDMYFDLGRVKTPPRSLSHPSRVYLTFNGLTYNGAVKPYSLMSVTKDIQDLYDVMHYHKENMIAMSGSKGTIVDISQIPNFGNGDFADNLKEWLYYKKLGAGFIDRAKEGADTVSS